MATQTFTEVELNATGDTHVEFADASAGPLEHAYRVKADGTVWAVIQSYSPVSVPEGSTYFSFVDFKLLTPADDATTVYDAGYRLRGHVYLSDAAADARLVYMKQGGEVRPDA